MRHRDRGTSWWMQLRIVIVAELREVQRGAYIVRLGLEFSNIATGQREVLRHEEADKIGFTDNRCNAYGRHRLSDVCTAVQSSGFV